MGKRAEQAEKGVGGAERMKAVRRDYVHNIRGFVNMNDVYVAVEASSSIVKLMCGVGNNAAYTVLSEAHEHIKRHPAYKGRAAGLFRKAFKDWRRYESNLLYAEQNRFFHVADMKESVRKIYGDITDREYFEYWQGLGGKVYVKTKPLITSLTNKFRLSLEHHGIGNAGLTAWTLTGAAVLELACKIWELAVEECCNVTGLQKDTAGKLFRPFLLRDIAKAWAMATDELAPGIRTYKLDEFEEGNINLSYTQIVETWVNPANVYDSASSCIEEYPEVFSSKKEMRLALAEMNEFKQETIEERKRIKAEKLLEQMKQSES